MEKYQPFLPDIWVKKIETRDKVLFFLIASFYLLKLPVL